MNQPNRPMDRFGRATAASVLFALGVGLAAKDASGTTPSSTPSPDHGAEVVLRALSLLGVNYRWGGNTPETGLDCSGLVRLVFSDAVGLPLPRRSVEISRVGDSVRRTDLQPGDLVFFNTLRRAFSHVGVYIGNNQFVHAPSTGGQVRVDTLDRAYWTQRFNGARRLLSPELAAHSVAPRANQAAAPVRPPRPLPVAASRPAPTAAVAAPRPGSGSRRLPAAPAPVASVTDFNLH